MALFLDLSNAFDSLDHDLLIGKLTNQGVQGTALELLKSYLNERSAQLTALGSISDSLPLEYGVPQGSVLGPLLFILYIRKLSNILDSLELKHHIYADDTQLYVHFKENELDQTKARIEQALYQVKIWLSSMSLKLNVEKTNLMVFSPRSKKHEIPYDFRLVVDGSQIQRVNEVKNLGVIFDSNLDFDAQIAVR